MKIKIFSFFAIALFFAQAGIAGAASLGEIRDFYVDPVFSDGGQTNIKATLRLEGEHAHYYMDNAFFDALRGDEALKVSSSLDKISKEYDSHIYPEMTQKIGSIREPGVDDDNKIYIVFLKLKEGNGGYMNTADLFLKSQTGGEPTNEKEIIYLNVDLINEKDMYGLLAHELQHLISANYKEVQKKIVEDTWLNELRSEYAPYMLGYETPYSGSALESRVLAFKDHASDSLTEWQNNTVDYAVVSIFGQYLVGNFGIDILKKTLESGKSGMESVDEYLKSIGSKDSFSNIFKKWEITNYLNDKTVFGKEYGYEDQNLNFKIKPLISHEIFEGDNKEFSYMVKDWQESLIEYYGNVKKINFQFEGKSDGIFEASYVLNRTNGNSVIGNIVMSDNKGSFSVDDLGGDVKSVILVPLAKTKLGGFANDEPKRNFIVKISTGASATNVVQNMTIVSQEKKQALPEGSLVRPAWDFKVYVVGKDGYIRHIQDQGILKFYDSKNISVLTRDDFDIYKTSSLVRAEGDFKVYEVDASGVRHWLSMSADNFLKSQRTFNSVFQISKNELELYKVGNNIKI